MIKQLLLASLLMAGMGAWAAAQNVVEVYRPIVESTVTTIPSETIVSYSPFVGTTAPMVTAWRPVTSTYGPVVTAAPAITTAYSPAVSYAVPMTTYRPVTSYSVPVTTYSPVVAYSPAVSYATPVSAYYFPTAVVQPRVYYPGQPIRNLFRAITP